MNKIYFLFSLLLFFFNVKASDFQMGNIHYTLVSLKDRTVEVTYPNDDAPNTLHGSMYKGDVIIPEIVSYKGQDFKVIGIGKSAFFNSQVTSVILSDSIKYIDDSGFYCSKKLKSINLPNGLLKIAGNAFTDCNLHSFTIPNTVTYIGIRGLPNADKIIFEEGKDLLTLGVSSIKAKELFIGRPIKMELRGIIEGFDMNNLTSLTIGKYVSDIQIFLSGKFPRNITLTIQNPNPPKLKRQLDNGLLVNAILRVPTGSVDMYKNADFYKNFFTIEEY